MLNITIPSCEVYNEEDNLFYTINEQKLILEHSLVSVSKWESKWKKPFLSDKKKTKEETIYYIKCMTTNKNVDEKVYYNLPSNAIEEIKNYIDDPMTATWINDNGQGKSREIVTSELIYYWMIAYQIPFECQKWHFNRLLMLIKVCNEKNKDPKKMSRSEILNRNRALNAARRKALNTKG